MNYSDWTEQELIELFEEQAAIREYCGGMERQAAERAAYFDWRKIAGRRIVAPEWIQKKARLHKGPGSES